MMNKINIQKVKIRLAYYDFWEYCKLKAPSFYKEDRGYLKQFCSDLQEFYENNEHKLLIINMPPRHGKSRTAGLFVEWALGKNQQEKIMTASYNEKLSETFSKSVRNNISEIKADTDKVVYTDIFPDIAIKKGDGAMNMWSLEGSHNNYLATSPGGTATGFGCNLLIVDDLIKNSEEAYNENTLSKHWDWFTNTMLSRLEEGGRIIVVMTRWATRDLAGRLFELYKDSEIKHITMKALQDDGSMLCDDVLSHDSYNDKLRAMGADIAGANYQQEPIDIMGKLYSSLKTYTTLPENGTAFKEIKNYTDTADTGNDYLCSITYGVYNKEAYILDVIYTKNPMEITEPLVAKMLFDNKVNIADIESNNGGRGFARSVQDILLNKYNSNHTIFKWFHQSKNKKSRILSNATWVMEHIYFPVNWRDRFPEFYEALNRYQSEGKNQHDDGPDALTGISEKVNTKELFEGWQ